MVGSPKLNRNISYLFTLLHVLVLQQTDIIYTVSLEREKKETVDLCPHYPIRQQNPAFHHPEGTLHFVLVQFISKESI